ncbi:MAG: phospholipase D-like domain-containing protein [Candidatus Woesearchaeota archaeon]
MKLFYVLMLSIFCVVAFIPQENSDYSQFTIDTYFCPDCTENYIQTLLQAQESIYCALYDFKHPDVQKTLDELATRIPVLLMVHETDYTGSIPLVKRTGRGLMHHKFCLIDERIILTGSANPTEKEFTQNNNNILIIESTELAAVYLQEFQRLFFERNFHSQEPLGIHLQTEEHNSLTSIFCPQSHCQEFLLAELSKAEESIFVLAFTFTATPVANQLLLAHYDKNIFVKGLFERRQRSQWWEFERLAQHVDVRLFETPVRGGILHQKVFIIDNHTVLAGSYNPTAAAHTINNENMLKIVHQPTVEMFLLEFERLWAYSEEVQNT